MAARVIMIHEKAENSFRRKAAWYYMNRGSDFVRAFTADIWDTYTTLSQMPSIGQVKKQTPHRTYAEFVSHPQVLIQYWYDDFELHILNLVYTKMRVLSQ